MENKVDLAVNNNELNAKAKTAFRDILLKTMNSRHGHLISYNYFDKIIDNVMNDTTYTLNTSEVETKYDGKTITFGIPIPNGFIINQALVDQLKSTYSNKFTLLNFNIEWQGNKLALVISEKSFP
jgi:hypothetical protein